jgi:hypothetical protein
MVPRNMVAGATVLLALICERAEAFASHSRHGAAGDLTCLASATNKAVSCPRRALLFAGGIALGQLAGVQVGQAFENRKAGVELFPSLNGVPYGASTPVPAGVGQGSDLVGCPSTERTARPSPNCFSSTAPKPSGTDQLYYVEPFSFKGKTKKQAMQELLSTANAYPPGQSNIDAGVCFCVRCLFCVLSVLCEAHETLASGCIHRRLQNRRRVRRLSVYAI